MLFGKYSIINYAGYPNVYKNIKLILCCFFCSDPEALNDFLHGSETQVSSYRLGCVFSYLCLL